MKSDLLPVCQVMTNNSVNNTMEYRIETIVSIKNCLAPQYSLVEFVGMTKSADTCFSFAKEIQNGATVEIKLMKTMNCWNSPTQRRKTNCAKR